MSHKFGSQFWFTSSLFDIEQGEDEETNPLCFGRQLSNWLRIKLRAKGYDVEDVIAYVESRLWAMATVLPIMQDTTIVAAGPTVANVSLTGAVPVGIVGDAGNWVKKPQ